jgi:broad specificity phosphatase PhoE
MQLLIIRHAESANNKLALGLDYADYVRQRSADPVITEAGVRQAALLAEHLGGEPPADAPSTGQGRYGITHLFCSPMLRTLQTIDPTAKALGLHPTVWPDIHEHGGMFVGNPRTGDGLVIHRGLTRTALLRDYPNYALPDSLTEEGWYWGGYEDMPSCYARAIRVARELRRRAHREHHQEQPQSSQAQDAPTPSSVVAIVSHGTFIDSLIKAIFNQVPENRLFYFHNNTAITRIDFDKGGAVFMRYLNRTAHLPEALITQ